MGITLADLVFQILSVVVGEEALVVHEENDFGNGNGAVAVVDGGGAVEDFEALFKGLVLRGSVLENGVAEEAIELAGRDVGLRFGANLVDHLEDQAEGLIFHRGHASEGGVVEEEEFLAEMGICFFQALVFGQVGVEEVPLVSDDEAGLVLLLDGAGNLAIHGSDAGIEIDDEKTEVGATNRTLAAHGGKDFHRGVHLGALAQTGGVDESVAFAVAGVRDVDGIAGGARYLGDDGALVFEDGIDERRFAGVGTTHDCDLEAFALDRFSGLDHFFLQGREVLVDEVGEGLDIVAVFGGGGQTGAEAEAREFIGGIFLLAVIALVDDEFDGALGFAQNFSQGFVDRGHAGAAIDHEENEVGGSHREIRFDGDRVREGLVNPFANTAGVDEFAGSLRKSAGGGDAIAGDPGLVVYNRNASSRQTVEEG